MATPLSQHTDCFASLINAEHKLKITKAHHRIISIIGNILTLFSTSLHFIFGEIKLNLENVHQKPDENKHHKKVIIIFNDSNFFMNKAWHNKF